MWSAQSPPILAETIRSLYEFSDNIMNCKLEAIFFFPRERVPVRRFLHERDLGLTRCFLLDLAALVIVLKLLLDAFGNLALETKLREEGWRKLNWNIKHMRGRSFQRLPRHFRPRRRRQATYSITPPACSVVPFSEHAFHSLQIHLITFTCRLLVNNC